MHGDYSKSENSMRLCGRLIIVVLQRALENASGLTETMGRILFLLQACSAVRRWEVNNTNPINVQVLLHMSLDTFWDGLTCIALVVMEKESENGVSWRVGHGWDTLATARGASIVGGS